MTNESMTRPKESPEEIAQELVDKHVTGLAMSIKDVAKYDTLVADAAYAIRVERARKSEPSKSFEECWKIFNQEPQIGMTRKDAASEAYKAATEAERARIIAALPEKRGNIEYDSPKDEAYIDDFNTALDEIRDRILGELK